MLILTVRNLKKAFVDRILFENLNFDIDSKDKVGLVGVNGCGKTTLMNMLVGLDVPDEGTVHYSKGTAVGTMQQHIESDDSTLLDSIMKVFSHLEDMERELEGIAQRLSLGEGNVDSLINRQHVLQERFEMEGGLTFRSRARAAALGLGFTDSDLKRQLKTFSGGQRNKAQLARVLLSGADLLMLDEPTNHLDVESIEWLEEYLKSYSGAFIIISHDRYLLDKVTNRTLELKMGTLYSSQGNYTRHMERRGTEREIQLRHYQNMQREIRRIYGIVEQQRRWGQERNFVTAESKLKQIERLKSTLVEPERDPQSIKFGFTAKDVSGNDVLIAEDLSKQYDGKKIFDKVNLHITKGERVFLIGANGCGKTTLLRILARQERSDSGFFNYGAHVSVGYYDQTLGQLSAQKSVLNEVWDDHYTKMTHNQIRNALAAFLFRSDDIEKMVANLSGGEKARVQLLKLMLSQANFLLLDEPTNHLDIASREALENALMDYGGTMIIVTHDRYLVNKLADRVLYMDERGITEYIGGYDDFVEAKPYRQKKDRPIESSGKAKQNDYKRQKELQSVVNRIKGEIRRIEERIMNAEAEQEAITAEMAKPDVASNYKKAEELDVRAREIAERVELLYLDWEKKNSELDAFIDEFH